MNGTRMTTEARPIVSRIRGHRHGPIVRLISPDEAGEDLKPFVFLDFFDAEIEPGFGFPMHPHSGIATLTWQPGSDVRYRDTTGKDGVLPAGGLEWMNAGGGAWHQGTLLGRGHATGFQLWVPMPPNVEDGPSLGQYVPPAEVPVVAIPGGSVRVLLGKHEHAGALGASTIDPHQDMDYFVVSLDAGARWQHSPPAGHDVAWAFAFEGDPTIQGQRFDGALMVLSGEGRIDLAALDGSAQILVGTARRHPHPLVMGPSSIHTNAGSLHRAAARIAELARSIPI